MAIEGEGFCCALFLCQERTSGSLENFIQFVVSTQLIQGQSSNAGHRDHLFNDLLRRLYPVFLEDGFSNDLSFSCELRLHSVRGFRREVSVEPSVQFSFRDAMANFTARIVAGCVPELAVAGRCPMPSAQDLIERARMFEERAQRASDRISRQHYREMAAHYRSLAVEHQETGTTRELEHGKVSE